MKYIDAEPLRKEIEKNKNMINGLFTEGDDSVYDGENDAYNRALRIIDSLQQEQPDFPTTDEEIERLLATHPKVEVPQKYKTPDWLWKKQEQPEMDLEKEIERVVENYNSLANGRNVMKPSGIVKIAHHFYELGLNARKED